MAKPGQAQQRTCLTFFVSLKCWVILKIPPRAMYVKQSYGFVISSKDPTDEQRMQVETLID